MPKRRKYLCMVASGLSVAVGGCLGSDEDPTPDDEDDDAATGTEGAETGTGGRADAEPETADGTGTETGDETDTALNGRIDITGSSTVYPLAQVVAEGFKQREPEVNFTLSSTGTVGGFSDRFCAGESDFNNASRPISAEEEQQCESNGVEYHELPLATDAITVVVNTDNDWLDCATTDDLREIWRADGASTWSDVDSAWPDEEIVRFGPADTSGTFEYFWEAVVGEAANHTSAYAPTERDNLIVQGVQSDRYAIGYLGFSYYRANSDAVTALAIDDGEDCVEPSLDTAANGEYPLARPLFTYVNTDRLGEAHVAEFARYFVERSANEELVADEVGYVPNTDEQMQAELAALNDAIENAR